MNIRGARPVTERRPIALVTGASSGIGEQLATRFAAGGHDLVLSARSAARLAALARSLSSAYGVRAWPMAADLALPGAPGRLAAACRRARRPIDVLVNNAGVLEHGPFAAMKPARHDELIALNIAALTAMLAHFVPPMLERGRGRVLNVASIAAFQPVPMLATYAATKAYVLSLTESLAEECKGRGVTVSALCPGITATPMLDAAQAASRELGKLPGFLVGSVDAVADEGYAACMKGDVICVPGVVNQATVLAGRAAPKWLLRRVSGALTRALQR
jgi:short-subunit dehydrogenase